MPTPDDPRRDADSPVEANWRAVATAASMEDRRAFFIAAARDGNILRLNFLKAHDSRLANAATLNAALLEACDMRREDICRLLLKWGANPKHDNSRALYYAVKYNGAMIVDMLLRAGADMQAAARHVPSKTPLPFVAVDARNHEALRALVMQGINPGMTDAQGQSLRARARDRGMQGAIELMNRLWPVPPAIDKEFVAGHSLAQLQSVFPLHGDLTGFQLAAYNGQIDALLAKLTDGGRRLVKSDLLGATPRHPQTILFILGQRRELHKVFNPALWGNDFAAMRAAITYIPAAFRAQAQEDRLQALERQMKLAKRREGKAPLRLPPRDRKP